MMTPTRSPSGRPPAIWSRQIAAPLGKGNGQLNEPRDADTDSHGDIYVADFANDRMAKFGPAGKWLRNWGTKGAEQRTVRPALRRRR